MMKKFKFIYVVKLEYEDGQEFELCFSKKKHAKAYQNDMISTRELRYTTIITQNVFSYKNGELR